MFPAVRPAHIATDPAACFRWHGAVGGLSGFMVGMALPATSDLTLPGGRVLRHCLYGPADGVPVISHGGSPSTRWRRPEQIASIEASGLRMLAYDRPGYGGSTRHPGRTVADAVADMRALADAYGWDRFAILGGSGGGPHALAGAALLGGRVTRCAVVSGVRPAEATAPGGSGVRPAGSVKPVRDEATIRASAARVGVEIMGAIEAGGPELPGGTGVARDDPDAMARLRATFVDSMDGWVDDGIALAAPWGFDPAGIAVPVGIWWGTGDEHVRSEHADWLLATIPGAVGHAYAGGHIPGPCVLDEIHAWLAT